MEQITIRDVAKLCGVGVSTVSRAINNHPDINEETKQMIMDIIKEYNYVPNNSARNLKRSDSKTIAVLVKGISNPFFGPMIQVLEREVEKKRYSFVLQHVEEEEDEVEVAIQLEKEKRLKGIVFLGGMYSHKEERLCQLTVPYVIGTVNIKLPQKLEQCAAISIDDEKESYRMVDYLCRCGHRKIVILTAARDDASIGKCRLEGYQRALEANGIEYDESLVVRMKKNLQTYTIKNGYEVTKELLDAGREFTCIYAISDTLAIGACKAIFDAGKRVPEDYCVAGFDGLDIAEYYEPSVTTIRQPREEMASEIIRILFDMIKKRPAEKQVIFEAKLVEGASTGGGRRAPSALAGGSSLIKE
ncbi:MAG: LacI family DNA-binding transcriptional regulator [Lachnospiraceae bacterium]|nr:LacI family DNA-binding transcriptional regulator [Lachnospiraceae bacterium]MDD3795408.1 LacI family DNA-binding transcriptional regulator [Lachnospiraceae bacterium]